MLTRPKAGAELLPVDEAVLVSGLGVREVSRRTVSEQGLGAGEGQPRSAPFARSGRGITC